MRRNPRWLPSWLVITALVVLFVLVGAFAVSVLPAGVLAPGAPPSIVATRIAIGTGTAPPMTATAVVTFTPTATTAMTTTLALTATATATATPMATTAPTATATLAANPVLTITRSMTADWKVYENREHGFYIKYPPTFTYSILQPSGPEILYDMIFYNGAKYEPNASALIGLAVFTNPQGLSTDAWAKAHLLSSRGSDQYSVQFETYQLVRPLNIAGAQAARLSVTSAANGISSNLILIPVVRQSRMIYMYYHIDPLTIEPLFEVMALTLERIP